jgi:hypothetical protein
VLKPSGVIVLSTENLASWHNLASLIFGWQPLSLMSISDTRLGTGNPLAVHRGKASAAKSSYYPRVCTCRRLFESVETHGFAIVEIRGSGCFPFSGELPRWDRPHAAVLALTGSPASRIRAGAASLRDNDERSRAWVPGECRARPATTIRTWAGADRDVRVRASLRLQSVARRFQRPAFIRSPGLLRRRYHLTGAGVECK